RSRTICSPTSCRAARASRCRWGFPTRWMRRHCWRRLTATRSDVLSKSPAVRYRSFTSTISQATHTLRSTNGSFGLWSAGGDDVWLDAYVTDFLTRAREHGFAVPDIGFKLALDRLRNFIANADDPAKDGGRNLAYALYVLARNGAAPIGD